MVTSLVSGGTKTIIRRHTIVWNCVEPFLEDIARVLYNMTPERVSFASFFYPGRKHVSAREPESFFRRPRVADTRIYIQDVCFSGVSRPGRQKTRARARPQRQLRAVFFFASPSRATFAAWKFIGILLIIFYKFHRVDISFPISLADLKAIKLKIRPDQRGQYGRQGRGTVYL